MLKKVITYKDLDGKDVTEEFNFHISKAEFAEMELSTPGGFGAYLAAMVAAENGAEIIAAFKSILMKAYGVRSEDNKRFIKSKELSEEFMQTDAYSVLFMELITDMDAVISFIRGIVPADMSDDVVRAMGVTDLELPSMVEKELTEMDKAELDELEMLKTRMSELLALKNEKGTTQQYPNVQ